MTDTSQPQSKVARLINEYNLDGVGEELEARWTAEGSDRSSLRQLADWFNQRLLERAMAEAGLNTIDMNLKSTYKSIVGDDVSSGVRTETRKRLDEQGIDIDELTNDFVSYQAIRSYLKTHRNAEYQPPNNEEKRKKDVETVQRLTSRMRTVIADRIGRSARTGRVPDGDYDVLIKAQVLCSECGSQVPATEFFEEGCDCGSVS